MKTQAYHYTAIFSQNDSGSYTVTVPALPGVVTEGRDLLEAQAMARDAIACHLESLVLDNEPLPHEGELAQMRLSVHLASHA